MRRICFLIMFSWICLLCNACGQEKIDDPTPLPDPDPDPPKEWQLVWGDEFDYKGLPNPEKWDYDEGFIRNEEDQYYTRARSDNAYVDNGVLTITGIKEDYPNKDYQNERLAAMPDQEWKTVDEYAKYTSACLITKGKFSWTYGKVEVRARLPKGLGVWPAIWTLGDNIWTVGWPKCGEIDIMEHVGFEPNTIHTNIHCENSAGRYTTQMRSRNIAKISEDFHVYSMEWDESKMTIAIDGVTVNTFNTSLAGDIFKKPQYLLLNLALGGTWGGEIDDSIFPQEYVIDYVRIYQKK